MLLSSNNNSAPTGNGYDGASDQLQTGASSDEVAAPYEGLRSVVHFGVTPWFESYINSKQGKTIDVSMAAGKKGADAQMGELTRSSSRSRKLTFAFPRYSRCQAEVC